LIKSKEYTEPPTKTIFVQLNPEKYTMKHTVAFCEDQAMGTSGTDLSFNKIDGEEVSFDFVFDSSGIVPPGKIKDGKGEPTFLDTLGDIATTLKPAIVNPFGEVETVEKDVEEFRKLLMGYDGETHQTAYLRLLWGGYSLSCRLKSMDIEYMLFRKDGRPIRAKVKCTFKGTVSYKLMVAQENKNSPDLTHERTIKMNDNLSLLSESIYENNSFYIDVAKNNKLLSFRKVDLGQKIKFPPIK
jgi:Contractile injection system tube protein